jgi:nucleoid DNA-binding protein
MDIDLLSKMVKELILDNDKVVLPGLGAFVAEVVPSTFSDKGYTINPPYRKLYFRAKPDEGSALVDFYASSNNVDREIADKVIRDFVAELKSVLFVRKTVVFPGLGRLRATKENAVFFIAYEDLDIYPEGFSLEPISLKTHVETREEVQTVMQELKQIVQEPAASAAPTSPAEEPISSEPFVAEAPVVEEPVAEELVIDIQEVTEQEIEPEPVPELEPMPESQETETEPEIVQEPAAVQERKPIRKSRSFWKIFAKILMWLVVVAVLFIGAFLLAAHYMPEFIDSILYTPDELDIINRTLC